MTFPLLGVLGVPVYAVCCGWATIAVPARLFESVDYAQKPKVKIKRT